MIARGITRARAALGHRALAPACAVALVAFYLATTMSRTAFGAPFLLAWSVLIAAFYLGWSVRWLAQRREASQAIAAIAALIAGATAGAAWYLAIRRAMGAERDAALWSAGLVLAAVIIGTAVRWRHPGMSGVRWVLPVQVVAAWIAIRASLFTDDLRLYDFYVYVGSGLRFAEGRNPYLAAPLSALPATAFEDVFLYPPPLLPFFAFVSAIPEPLRSQVWIALLTVTGIVALRLLGMAWPWPLFLVLFPPLVKGIESGNVANVTFLILTAAPLVPALLPLGVLFKPQLAIPSLWLLRERRWRSVLAGVLVFGAIVGVTLPLVGPHTWFDWAAGLGHREASQREFPLLYGHSLAQYLPIGPFVAVAMAAIALPLFLHGKRSLAGLGLATIIAAPSLWPHGFIFAIPAVLSLNAPLVWLALGIADGPWLWVIVAAGYLGLALGDWDRSTAAPDPTHPAGGGLWPRATQSSGPEQG